MKRRLFLKQHIRYIMLALFCVPLISYSQNRSMPGASSSAPSPASTDPNARPLQIGDYVELDPSVRNEMYGTIDFPNAELKDIVKAISKLANKNFILDRKIENRRITIISPETVTKQEAYNAFLSALYINDLTIISVGKFLQIIDAKTAIQNNTRVFVGDYAPASEEIVTLLYPLRNLNAEDVQRYLVDLVPRNGRITAYPNTNTLVMTGTGINLRRVIAILKSIDIPGHQDQLENIPIRHASAKGIADLIEQILDAQGGNRNRTGRTRNEPQKTRGGGIISKIVPDERTNSLVVLANGRGIEELKLLISKLDSPNSSGSGNIHIYYCKNAKAEELAETINSLISSKNDRRQTFPGGVQNFPVPGGSNNTSTRSRSTEGVSLEGNIKVTADKATNALVVVGSSSDFTALKAVLQRLDIPRKQVYIEATIMEIAARDDRTLNVGVNIAGQGNPRVGGFIPSGLNIRDYISSPVGLSGVVAGIGAGRKYPFTFGSGSSAQNVTISTVTGLINAIQTSGQGQILHQPQILTSDNQDAEINVKDKIPVPQTSQSSGSGSTTIATTTFNKEDVNITLKVTPQIGEDNDLVKMKIEQSVDDFTPSKLPLAKEQGQVDVTQRKATTTVSVRDGDTVVIGGLQKVTFSDSRDKIPLLGDLPVLGWLFKGSKSEQVRSNLVIFMTPKIINEYRDIIDVTGKKLETRERFGAKLSDPTDKLLKEVRDLQKKNKEDALKAPPKSWSFKPPAEDGQNELNDDSAKKDDNEENSAWVQGLQPDKNSGTSDYTVAPLPGDAELDSFTSSQVGPPAVESPPSGSAESAPTTLSSPGSTKGSDGNGG